MRWIMDFDAKVEQDDGENAGARRVAGEAGKA
jgi:hypothetical protein